MQTQLSPNTAWTMLDETWVQRMFQVRMISVQHPLDFAVAQDGKVWIAVDNLSAQYFTVKGQCRCNVTHEKIQRETTQGAPIGGGWHPGITGS